jgi:hypothetical protein
VNQVCTMRAISSVVIAGLPASLKLRRPQQSVPGEAFWRSRDPAIHRATRFFKGWMRGSSPRMTSE